jgi:outer membrane autotransporter protein
MLAAIALAGALSPLERPADPFLKTRIIHPDGKSLGLAVELGLRLGATKLDAARVVSLVNAERLSIEAGLAFAAVPDKAPPKASEPAAPRRAAHRLPVAAKVAGVRISGTIHRSIAGEPVAAPRAVPAETIVIADAAGSRSADALGPAGQEPGEPALALLSLIDEAHAKHGKTAITAQAMSDYLSLYVMRDRAEAVGRMLLNGGHDSAVAGAWAIEMPDHAAFTLAQGGEALGLETRGAAAGFDAGARNLFGEGDRLTVGMFAAIVSAQLEDALFAGPGVRETQDRSLGFYGVYDKGPWTLSGLLRADMTDQFDRLASERIDFSAAIRSMKAEVSARYRFEAGDWRIEPSAALAYSAASSERRTDLTGQMAFQDAESLTASVGVTVGGVVYNRGDVSVEPSVTISLNRELLGSGDVTFLTGAPMGATKPSGRTVGAVSLSVDVIDSGIGLRGFVKADGQVSDGDKPSAGVSAGVRTQW